MKYLMKRQYFILQNIVHNRKCDETGYLRLNKQFFIQANTYCVTVCTVYRSTMPWLSTFIFVVLHTGTFNLQSINLLYDILLGLIH